jgi:hypothetical protein
MVAGGNIGAMTGSDGILTRVTSVSARTTASGTVTITEQVAGGQLDIDQYPDDPTQADPATPINGVIADGAVKIITEDGTLYVNDTTASIQVSTTNDHIWLQAGDPDLAGGIGYDNLLQIGNSASANTATVSNGGGANTAAIDLLADAMTFDPYVLAGSPAVIDAGAGFVYIRPLDATGATNGNIRIGAGATDVTGTGIADFLGLTDGELNTVAGGAATSGIIIGEDSNTGDLTGLQTDAQIIVVGALDLTAAAGTTQRLALTTANAGTGASAAIYDGTRGLTGNIITASELSLFAEGGIDVTTAGTLKLRATSDTSGDIIIDHSGGLLTIDQTFWERPDAEDGVYTSGSFILIQSSSGLTVTAGDAISAATTGFIVIDIDTAEQILTLNAETGLGVGDGGKITTNDAEIHLTADQMVFNTGSSITANGAHNIYLNSQGSADGDDEIRLGVADAAGATDVLGLAEGELEVITIGTPANHALVIGSAAIGANVDVVNSQITGITTQDGGIRFDASVDVSDDGGFTNLTLIAGSNDDIYDNGGSQALTESGNVALIAGDDVFGTNALAPNDNLVWYPLRVNAASLTADIGGYMVLLDTGGLNLVDAIDGIAAGTLVNLADKPDSNNELGNHYTNHRCFGCKHSC